MELARPHFGRRITAIREAVNAGTSLEGIRQALLELGARWTPDALAATLGDALELSSWSGREQVYLDDLPDLAFAYEAVRQSFKEQIDFLRQKRPMPTKSWLDALYGVHDRAFVIAGATDVAMLEEFQEALIKAAAEGLSVEAFGKDFDRIVAKYGWDHFGDRDWRVRTIFETNMRTSFMAGRLRQMRDPDVVKMRPFWRYVHAYSRIPMQARPIHLEWDGLVLLWNDPWWEVHFPPNDWLCSCGVRTMSRRDLESMGKTGPDEAPKDVLIPTVPHGYGEMVMQPRGIGFGWQYMPGDHWARGIVPSELTEDVRATMPEVPRHVVSVDSAEPLADLITKALPFKQKPMAAGLPPEDYIKGFKSVFENSPAFQAPFWVDQAGHKLVIDDEIFRDRQGKLKIEVGDRGQLAKLLAETIIDPDEIWLGVRELLLPNGYASQVMTRRYIRLDGETGMFAAFDLGPRFWSGITGFRPSKAYDAAKAIKTNWSYLSHERVGKLLWKRKGQP